MAASILSFGMLTARAFWMTRRNVGFDAGSEPPALTAMVMSLAMRANCFAMRFQRANIVCLRTSKMRPITVMVHERHRACQRRQRSAEGDSVPQHQLEEGEQRHECRERQCDRRVRLKARV